MVLVMNAHTNGTRPGARKLDEEMAWRQVAARQTSGEFFFGVRTTGVFCRPGCGSRMPLRKNVRFFWTADEALKAGFRPCARCKPQAHGDSAFEQLRAHLEAHLDRAVPLAELGRVAGISPFTAQRLFKREMGISPLAYQRALRAGSLRTALKRGATVTEAVYEAGFRSSSRAYEDAGLGMTPARFARGGKGEQVRYAIAQTPFGWMAVGATERGLCWLALGSSRADAEAGLKEEFPLAATQSDPALETLVEAALRLVREGDDLAREGGALDLRGTVFQLRVWQALRQIPRGTTKTYSQLARELGMPKATRAVARACAMNRVALVVPCHRVVGANGSLTGYRWGVERKRKLLEAEGATPPKQR